MPTPPSTPPPNRAPAGPEPGAPSGVNPDMNEVVGSDDLLFVTLDTLRYDVAAELAAAGRIPHLARHLPGGRWEERHAPGNFTYASHQAMFAGFLPTPAAPGPHERL
ncbi:metalloenzyme domain-containing protein, partial [Streptomyces varsoviensis]